MIFLQRIITALLFSVIAFNSYAADTDFTPAQQTQIQNIVHDYLVNNPQVLVEASRQLMKQQGEMRQQQAQKAIIKNAAALYNNKISPVVGNKKGSITVIEFLDYQCPHCKDMGPVISQLIKQNPDVRVIFKQWPIFGAVSETASRMALAVAQQQPEKYFAFHNALLNYHQPLTEDTVMQIAKDSGVDVSKVQSAMNDSKFATEFSANQNLADEIGFDGTPSLIISKTPNHSGVPSVSDKIIAIPGGADLQQMTAAVAQVK